MNVEVYRCDLCGRVLFMDPAREPNVRPSGALRGPECGGENLSGYGGGQTHNWSPMRLMGLFALTQVKA